MNYKNRPLMLVIMVILILTAVSFIKVDHKVLGLDIKTVDIYSDLKPKKEVDKIQNEEDDFFKPQYENEEEDDFFKPQYDLNDSSGTSNQNSADQISYTASVIDYERLIERTTALLNLDNSDMGNSILQNLKNEPIVGNVSQMKFFFDALKNADKSQVRIAHFGDSLIEGDLISADVRETMQKEFGGKGVGYLPITSQDVNFRLTTKISFSNNWETGSLFGSNPNRLEYGINGEVFVPKGNSWVEYELYRKFRNAREFSKARVFYSDAKASAINYVIDGKTKDKATLSSGKGLQELVIDVKGSANKLRLEFPERDQAHVYGVSLENGNGVYLDNFPFRGNSGADLQQISSSMLKDFARKLDYKLIILEFGLNASGTAQRDFGWYEREMLKVIDNLKSAFPRTAILLIGVQDKSVKKGTRFETDPKVVKLLDAQKNIAKSANIAFWNLFEAMGGENSMPQWVDANPPLAFKDYVHFNGQGASKVADMLSDALITAYKKLK